MLLKHFQKDSGLLLDLVTYMIVDEDNAGQYYPDFAFNHPLFSEKMRIYSDSKVCRFLKSVTKDQMIGFLDDWNKKRDHDQRIYISYDSTNKNCHAGDIDIAEYGKPKADQGLPIFNLAIAYDKNNRVPLFYEEYPGSINDVSQFQYMVDKVEQYHYKNVGFILDRGYFSKDNICYMEKNGYPFIIMVKGHKSLVSELVFRYRNTFETKRECCIRSYRVYGTTVQARLYEDDTCDRYFHIYYNPSKLAAEREQLELWIDRIKTFLDKHIGEKITIPKTYQELFTFRTNKAGELVSYSEKTEAITRRLELCGYFAIITSEKMNAKQAISLYKNRDASEKLFRADKSYLGNGAIRVASEESANNKIFIGFIALIIRCKIYTALKDKVSTMVKKPNYFTVPAAIRELEKIEMCRQLDNVYRLDHAVTKTQKEILSAFGIEASHVKYKAAYISQVLQEGTK